MKEILILICLAAAGWFGYDAMVVKQDKLDDLSKEVTRLKEDNEKLAKVVASYTKRKNRPGTSSAGVRASVANPESTTRNIRCYFCDGIGKYQAKLGSRLSQSPCAVCKGSGNREFQVPVGGHHTICGSNEDKSAGSGSAQACRGMGFLAVKRAKGTKIGDQGKIEFDDRPDGSSRYTSQTCSRCQGRGYVKRAIGEEIR